MLIWSLAVLTVAAWSGIGGIYFRRQIFQWFDHRYGMGEPNKPPRPRRRMFD